MASFARDVTTAIEIPTVQAPDFTKNRSSVGDAIDIIGFGLGIQERNNAKEQEADRVGLLNTANSIAGVAESSLQQPGGSVTKSLNAARKSIAQLGLDPTRTAQLQSVVSQRLGFKTIGQAVLSEQQKFDNALDGEFDDTKKFGVLARSQLAPGQTWSEQSTETKELIVERALQLEDRARVSATNRETELKGLRDGNFATAQGYFKTSKDIESQISGTMLSIYKEELNKAQKQGLTLGLQQLQSMKDSMVSVQENFKQQLNDNFSEDNLLNFNEKDSKRLRIARDSAIKRFDDKIAFINQLETDAFKDFTDTAALLKDQDEIDLQESMPKLLQFRSVYGSPTMNTLIASNLAKNPALRNALKGVVINSLDTLGLTQTDSFTAGMTIMAGIGKGKAILDYDAEDNNQAANIYWETTKAFVENPSMIETSSKEGITKMAIAAVQVLEFAEERGTDDDKQRAIKTLNSPGFKALYDKSEPDVKSALGRKILQYNRDTIANTAKRFILEQNPGIGKASYNANTGKFEFKAGEKSIPVSGLLLEGGGGVTNEGNQRRREQARADELNKQLAVIDIYAQDDPFLAGLSSKQRKDFFIRSAGLPATAVTGTLSEFTAEDEQAQAQGVTIQELRDVAEQGTNLGKQAEFFSDVERQVQQAGLSPELQQQVKDKVTSLINGEPDKDFADLTDEELDQLFADEKERRAKSK